MATISPALVTWHGPLQLRSARLRCSALRLCRAVGAGICLALVGILLICLAIPVLCLLPAGML